MPRYIYRWLVAVFGVAPVMLLLVPAAQLLFWGLEGPHANDSLWEHFLGMLGFYGGYLLVAATIVSLLHTWLVRRYPSMERAPEVLLAVVLGMISLMPQAAVFGKEYWAVNLAAGVTAGALYGLVVMRRPPVSARR